MEQHRATELKIVGLNPTISFCSSFSLQKMAPFSEMVLNREKLSEFVRDTHGKNREKLLAFVRGTHGKTISKLSWKWWVQ